MTEFDKGQKADRRPRKYLWFGYGNYTAQGNLQIPAGDVRAPDMLAAMSKESKGEHSPMAFFGCVLAALVGLTALAMLLAWGLSLAL